MGLLEKAQKKKQQSDEPEESPETFTEETLEKETIEEQLPKIKGLKITKGKKTEPSKSLLEKAQKKKQQLQQPPTTEEPLKEPKLKKEPLEKTEGTKIITKEKPQQSTGLLEKAKQQKEEPPAHKVIVVKEGQENIEGIEQEEGLGWKQLASRRIIFDHNLNEYRYELIEPSLNKAEKDIKKEIAHLFKMLADIDTFDMDKKEKEKFLEDTIEQIIIDNDIRFDKKPKQKSLFKSKKENEIKETKEKKPKKSLKLFGKKSKETEEHESEIEEEPEESMFTEQSRDKVYYYLFRDFLGYGRIDLLMHDDGIEDISCDGPHTPIFIHHRKYEAIETNIYFDGEEELNSFIVRLCQISGKQISIYSPIVDGKLPDGSRLQSTLARTVTKGSTFTIRKFKENPLIPIDLIENKTLSVEMCAYFWMAIESGASILFCGGTASGKTTSLNALSLFIPASHKIVSIEDTREVNLPHKNWIAGTTREGFSTSDENKTGKDIDMFDLIRAALRQRPRVIIVGEVRGREAYSLFQAMATGHTSYSTVHASSIHTLIQRLENPPISLPRALLTSLDMIVFQNAVEIGRKMVRRMTSVTEIIKLDTDTNQLIFMAPFTWASKTDDRFESSGSSKILNRIKQQNDWTDEQLEEELNNRILILEWIKKKNIRSYQEFGRVVADYQKYPQQVLNKVKKEMEA